MNKLRYELKKYDISDKRHNYSIAKMMGHKNIINSQIYAKITDDKISKDMDKLMERRKMESACEMKRDNGK